MHTEFHVYVGVMFDYDFSALVSFYKGGSVLSDYFGRADLSWPLGNLLELVPCTH